MKQMNMIEELQLRKDDYEELLVYYFMQLLILLHRQISNCELGDVQSCEQQI